MTRIRRSTGVSAAAAAAGPTAVIDTFRAFTTAAVLFDRGVSRIVLTDDVAEAVRLSSALGALTCGEVDGRKPFEFDLSNSPAEAEDRGELAGRTVVQRTSGGTRSVVAAIDAGALPVYATSLVVATATARALFGHDEVTIVSAGLGGEGRSDEDDLTGDHIASLLQNEPMTPDIGGRVAATTRAQELRRAPWAGARDVEIASTLDRYDFAMRAERTPDGLIELVKTPS